MLGYDSPNKNMPTQNTQNELFSLTKVDIVNKSSNEAQLV